MDIPGTKNNFVIKLFFIGIVLSSVLMLPFILDVTLTPRFIALAVCLSLCFYYLFNSGIKFDLKPDLILLSYFGYTLFCLLSISWSNTRSEAVFESSKQALAFIVFGMTYYSLKSNAGYFLKIVLKFSIVLFLFAVLISVYQFTAIKNFNKESLYLITGISGHKNLFSSLLFLDLCFLIMAAYKLDRPWKNIALICIIINGIFLFLLRTKAVWLGLSASALVFFILYFFSHSKSKPPRIKLSVLLISALLFSNIFFLKILRPLINKSIHYVTNHTSSQAFKQEDERLILWDKTYELINKKPLAGVGMGNWQIHLPSATLTDLWRAEDLNYTFQRPHNDFLWILSETGLIGFNLFLLFLFSLLFLSGRTLRTLSKNESLRFDLLLCITFICGYFITSFFDFPKERIEHLVWINILFGMAYFSVKTQHSPIHFRSFIITRKHVFISFVLLILFSYVGLLRFNGEYFTRRMYKYKSVNKLSDVVDAGNSALSIAYSIDPTSVPLFWYTGNARASLGNYEGAQTDFIKAYHLNPFNPKVLNDLASSYVFTNNVLLAKNYYEEAARISPRYDEPKLNLAAMYINAKDYKTAAAWLKSLMHDSERRSNYEKFIELNKEILIPKN